LKTSLRTYSSTFFSPSFPRPNGISYLTNNPPQCRSQACPTCPVCLRRFRAPIPSRILLTRQGRQDQLHLHLRFPRHHRSASATASRFFQGLCRGVQAGACAEEEEDEQQVRCNDQPFSRFGFDRGDGIRVVYGAFWLESIGSH
jgi:hypothetical protein